MVVVVVSFVNFLGVGLRYKISAFLNSPGQVCYERIYYMPEYNSSIFKNVPWGEVVVTVAAILDNALYLLNKTPG